MGGRGWRPLADVDARFFARALHHIARCAAAHCALQIPPLPAQTRKAIIPRAAVAANSSKAGSIEEMNAAIGQHIKVAAKKAAAAAKDRDSVNLAHCIAAAAALAASGKLVAAGAKKQSAATAAKGTAK